MRRMEKCLRNSACENGIISVAYTMAILIILFVISSALLTSVSVDLRGSTNKLLSSQTFYIAEAGIEWTIKMLSDSVSFRKRITNIPIGNGTAMVILDDSSTISALQDTTQITSIGKFSGFEKSVIVKIGLSGGWSNVLMSGGGIDFGSGSGKISGNIHTKKKVKLGKYTLNGTVTQTPDHIDLPTIDWNYFENDAKAIGQCVPGSKNFDSFGSPYSGVWYIRGKATITSNKVVINGTLVVENDLDIKKNKVSITAFPLNYPALIVGKSVRIRKNNAEINGFVYCENDFEIKKNNFQSVGVIVAGNKIKGSGKNSNIIFDSSYLKGLVGVSAPGGSSFNGSLKIFSWH
jgi:hypothetical protein